MASSWPNYVSECKSRLSAIARSCYLGRGQWREKALDLQQTVEELRARVAASDRRNELLEQENGQLRDDVSALKTERDQPRPIKLPLGETPPGQQYGDGFVSLCVNLARKIGLRPTVRVLQVFWEWLGVEEKIPTWQSIRLWMQRIGLARLGKAKRKAGGVWLADHTNQIGKEKVLAVMRVRGSTLPRPGTPLRHQDLEVLALIPGETWKRENVAEAYLQIAKRCGDPRAIESDGAVELREPAETLGKPRKKPLVIRDMKHFLANKLEALLKQDHRYQAFTQKLGGTRSALQQTELAHFIPPGIKMKARFMNLASTLTWAGMVLWHLDHPESKSRENISASRMAEKLGWLREFTEGIREWQACQDVISATLTFINQQGVFQGVTKEFQKLAAGLEPSPMSRRLVEKVVVLLRKIEKRLRPGERLPMSTEILESSFALYKQLEKQHSKSGFTSLLLAFPTLLRETTAKEVAESLTRVKVDDVERWTKKYLPNTLASRRQLVFRESRADAKAKNQNSATPLRKAG